MDTVTRVQIRDEFDCISQRINTFGNVMNPSILPSDKGRAVKHRLKIDRVSHPSLGSYVFTNPSAFTGRLYVCMKACYPIWLVKTLLLFVHIFLKYRMKIGRFVDTIVIFFDETVYYFWLVLTVNICWTVNYFFY